MDTLPKTTTHDEIKLWAQTHDAVPEIVETGSGETLRLNFPGPEDDVFLGETTEEVPVEWDEFFGKFEELGLAFQYNPKAEGIDLSTEYKFIKREENSRLQ